MNKKDLQALKKLLLILFNEEAQNQGTKSIDLTLYTCSELMEAIEEYIKL